MPIAIVTGSGGLIGSEAVRHLVQQGFDVIGIENDMRARFFGPEASTGPTTERLVADLGSAFRSYELDIRDFEDVLGVFGRASRALELVVHTAAQPSHDWAATNPRVDFAVNANGTLNVLEATRLTNPTATFIHCSTNKVYGDLPNDLPLYDAGSRLELPADHEYFAGVPETMPIDRCLHSVFGASKAAADLMVQEYGRYFGMPTVCFRGGCLTGPAHAGTELHGFLSYLMKCTVARQRYTVLGYEGKQVRDNIHAADVIHAFDCFHANPRPAAVYNLGGGRRANVSVLEAIALCQEIAGCELDYDVRDEPRVGDHRWYISDTSQFERDYPAYRPRYGIAETLREIHDANVEDWARVTT